MVETAARWCPATQPCPASQRLPQAERIRSALAQKEVKPKEEASSRVLKMLVSGVEKLLVQSG